MKLYIPNSTKKIIKASIIKNKPILLIGETGVGKTTIIREYSKKVKKTLHRVSLNGSTSTEEILGRWLVKDGTTYWQDGILSHAMKNGDWIVFDEINAALPEILFSLHSLLDDDKKITLVEKDNEVVYPHKEFRFFASMNPSEEYSGTKEMNKALISRFSAVCYIDVLDNKEEKNLLVKEFNCDEKNAELLVSLATDLRKKKQEDEIFYFCSTRDLIHTVHYLNAGLSLSEAIPYTIVEKMSKSEIKEIESIIKKYIDLSKKDTFKTFFQIEQELINEKTILENKINFLEEQIKKGVSGGDSLSEIAKVLSEEAKF